MLGLDAKPEQKDKRALLIDRLIAAAAVMTDEDLQAAAAQADAVIGIRHK